MKSFMIFFAIAVVCCSSLSLRAADEKMTVVDYYLLLPEKTFEAPARDWLQTVGPLVIAAPLSSSAARLRAVVIGYGLRVRAAEEEVAEAIPCWRSQQGNQFPWFDG